MPQNKTDNIGMRRIILPALALAILIAAGFINYGHVKRIANEIDAQILGASSAPDAYAAQAFLAQASAIWTKNEFYLSAVLLRDNLDSVTIGLEEAAYALSAGDTEEFAAILIRIRTYIALLLAAERPSAANIL